MWQFTIRFLLLAITLVSGCMALVHYFGLFGAIVVGVFYVWILMPVWLTFTLIYFESRGGRQQRPKQRV